MWNWTNYWWQIVIPSVVTLLLGLGISEWYHRRSDSTKRLKWQSYYRPIVSRQSTFDNTISVRYGDEEVTSVCIHWIVIWNGGRSAISIDDLSSTNPLTISVTQGAKLLGARIIGQSDKGSNAQIELRNDCRSAGITFDFLNPRHGVAVVLTHTETDLQLVALSGSIKNGEPLHQVPHSYWSFKPFSQIGKYDSELVSDFWMLKPKDQRNVFFMIGYSLGFATSHFSEILGTLFVVVFIYLGLVIFVAKFPYWIGLLWLLCFLFGGSLLFWIRRSVNRPPVGLDNLFDDTLRVDYWDRKGR